jgi:hypothetical protein
LRQINGRLRFYCTKFLWIMQGRFVQSGSIPTLP